MKYFIRHSLALTILLQSSNHESLAVILYYTMNIIIMYKNWLNVVKVTSLIIIIIIWTKPVAHSTSNAARLQSPSINSYLIIKIVYNNRSCCR
jgi:hypothetical protein